jgi:hypothetical protein
MVPNLQLEAEQEKKAALEKENRDLRSALSRLESKLQSKERVYIYIYICKPVCSINI